MVEAFGKYFERFVRWIYPGMLLLLLFHLGRPDLLGQFRLGEEGIFGLIVLIVIFSFIIYCIHRFVIHELILLFFCCIDHGSLAKLAKKNRKLSKDESGKTSSKARWIIRVLKFLVYPLHLLWQLFKASYGHYSNYCQKEKIFLKKRFGEDLSDYLIHRWAIAHAIGITGWLLLFMYVLADDKSCLGNLGSWVVTGICIFIPLYFHQNYLLTGVEETFIERRPRSPKKGRATGKKSL